jgi:hypothetical protein
MADRAEYVMRTIEVTHVAKPYGTGRDINPPHLWDLRRFVEACEGLPDTLVVNIKSSVRESGSRFNMTFSVKQVEPVTDEMVDERASKLNWFRRESS